MRKKWEKNEKKYKFSFFYDKINIQGVDLGEPTMDFNINNYIFINIEYFILFKKTYINIRKYNLFNIINNKFFGIINGIIY